MAHQTSKRSASLPRELCQQCSGKSVTFRSYATQIRKKAPPKGTVWKHFYAEFPSPILHDDFVCDRGMSFDTEIINATQINAESSDTQRF